MDIEESFDEDWPHCTMVVTIMLPQWHVKDPDHSAKMEVAGYT